MLKSGRGSYAKAINPQRRFDRMERCNKRIKGLVDGISFVRVPEIQM